jgi:hypothetical protein
VILAGAPLFAQTEGGIADKLSFDFEFGASVLSVDSEGVVDSLTDAGFNEDETKIGVGYEDELWGASLSFKFGLEHLKHISGWTDEKAGGAFPLALDELYGWVKPFGGPFKFTGGIFENTDGTADYTGDIDEYSMGVFAAGGDEGFLEPEAEFTGPALVNGFLTEAAFGPITIQFLLAPNYSKESASIFLEEELGQSPPGPVDERLFRLGGRVIADAGAGTVSALFKTFQQPAPILNELEGSNPGYPGAKVNWTTFGAYFELTAVENLGVSLGYTGFLPSNDESGVDNVLYSGIDLRAAWTGIEGLSLSTHNNISFAKGAENDWMGVLGKDSSFLTLYNAAGATKELNEKFSVNAGVSNLLSITDQGGAGKSKYDKLGLSAKFIVKVTEHAEFNIGARVDIAKTAPIGGEDETVTTFSIPAGIIISF